MNLYKVNLNLLKVFVVLMREQHVSDAAKYLHLSQPAISNALQQLRELFQDELLIRGPKKMVPTQKALFLAPQVTQILSQLETILFYSDKFEYKTSKRTFVLGMTDYAEYILLPKIYENLAKLAPNISLKILAYNEFYPEDFENEKLELGIGLEKKVPKQLVSERLYSDVPVCVAHAKHLIFEKPFTIEAYLQAEHLAACVYSEELSRIDKVLKKLNLKRHIKLTLPNALPVLQTVSTSNLIATISRNLVIQAQKEYHLKYVSLPFNIPEYHIAQIWHRQQNNDSGLIWLRSLIKKVCDECFLKSH